MKTETLEFYFLNHTNWSIMGPYHTEQDARTEAQAECEHTDTISILKVTSKSSPPPMTRKWKAAA